MPSSRGAMDIEVTITRDEWGRVFDLLRATGGDETAGEGQVRLTCDEGRRRWSATDGYRAMFFEVDGGPEELDVGVSSTLLAFVPAAWAGGETASVVVSTDDDGERVVAVQGPGGRVDALDTGHDFPDLRASVVTGERVAGTATIAAETLLGLVHSALRIRRLDEDDEPTVPPILLGIENGRLVARQPWGDLGPTDWRLQATDCDGDVVVEIHPRQLLSMIEVFDLPTELRLILPTYNVDPLVVTDGELVVLLMPIKTDAVLLDERTKAVIAEVCGHLAVQKDADGDFPLARHGTSIYARLVHDSRPPTLQVFAVALDSVEPTSELLAELNDLNAASQYARIFHVNGQVLVEADLVAETLDAHELRTAIRRIREVATDLVPVLAAVFGGRPLADPAQARRDAYRTAIVEMEVLPGSWHTLNGPDATPQWPFPDSVFVITGWNPQGVVLSESLNESVNRQIATDIIERGGRFVLGHGRSPDGSHIEESLIAWGITTDDAVEMGRKASQDAVFEIDADEVHLLSCVNDAVESWPRRA